MPYDLLASLPSNVKSKPEATQRRWMAVWNSHYKTCIGEGNSSSACETEAFRLANGVIKGAEMDDDTKYGEPDIGDVHAPGPIGVVGPKKRKMRQTYDDATGSWADDDNGPEVLLEKSDKRVNYRMADDPEGWTCGNCVFHDADCLSCNLVEGTISASCVCDLWRAQIPELTAMQQYREPSFRVFMEVSQAFGAGQDFSKPAWIPFLPVPGRYDHALYGEIIITPDSNRELVDSVKAHVYQTHIPIDAEHETKLSGAVGWLNDMRMNADGSADAFVEWTPRGQQLLADGAFKYVSPEWYSEWLEVATGKVHQNVVAGGAITTRPFFKEKVLRALVATEAGGTVIRKSDKEDTQVPDDKKTTAAAETPPADGAPKEPVKATEASDVTKTAKTFSEAEVQALVAQTKADAITEASQAYADQLKVVSDKADASTTALAEITKADRKRRFTEMVSGRGGQDDGAPWAGDAESHLSMLESLSEQFGEGEDSVTTKYIENQRAVAAQIKDSAVFKEFGSSASTDSTDPDARLDALAKARQASDPSLNYAKAYNEILTTPEGSRLYNQKYGAAKP